MENHYAMGDFLRNSQVHLERAMTEFTQQRNWHCGPTTIGLNWGFMVFYVLLLGTIAWTSNLALIAGGHPENNQDRHYVNGEKFPTLFPFVTLFDYHSRTAIGIQEAYIKLKLKTSRPEALGTSCIVLFPNGTRSQSSISIYSQIHLIYGWV